MFVGLVAHLGLKAGVGLHGGVVALVEAVCEPFEGVANAHLEGAQALAVAFQGYLYRRRIMALLLKDIPREVICFNP